MRVAWFALLTMIGFGFTSPSLAAEPTAEPRRAEAAEYFSRGLHLFESGDNRGALVAFQRAYELIPNRIVLFNIGLVHAAMGDPAKAVGALDEVLEAPGTLNAEQLARARRVKAEQERRLGGLHITTNIPADIDVDGVQIGRTPLSAPVRMAVGAHVVGAGAAGYLPERREVSVVAEAPTAVSFELRPAKAEGMARVGLELQPEAGLGMGQPGRLSIVSRDVGQLRLTVDGRDLGPYRGDVFLPAGPHRLRLERAGYQPIERTVQVVAGAGQSLKIDLRPTAEIHQPDQAQDRTYRRWAFSALIGGLALAGGGGGFTYWSHVRLGDARDQLAGVRDNWGLDAGADCWDSEDLSWQEQNWCDEAMTGAQDDVSRYRNLRTAGIVVTTLGVGLAVTGAVILIRAQESRRSDDRNHEALASSLAWHPLIIVGSGGGGVAVARRF